MSDFYLAFKAWVHGLDEEARSILGEPSAEPTSETAKAAVGKKRSMRGKNLRLSTTEVLERAERLIGTGDYSLEEGHNGGADPEADWPYFGNEEDGTADCVGVGMYIQGFDRYQPQIEVYGGWVNTNSVWLMPTLFTNLGQDFGSVQPGVALVYKSYRDALGRRRYGHWMTVYDVPRGAKRLRDLTVIHCAQKPAPATRVTWAFAKGNPKDWAFFRPLHRMGLA